MFADFAQKCSFCYSHFTKLTKFALFYKKNLHISKKSSTFAP